MTVNEIILIVVIIAILTGLPWLLKRMGQPWASSLKIGTAILLLVFAWFFSDGARLLPKLVLTGIAVYGITRAIFDYVKSSQGTKPSNS